MDKENSIESTKHYILNRAIVFGTFGGWIAYTLSLVQLVTTGFEISFITDFIVLGVITLIALYHKRLSINFKATAILLGISIVVLIDVYEIGILSANKVLLILIPFFAIMSYSVKKTITISSVTLIGFVLLAYMHITKMLPEVESINLGIVAWVINFIMIAMVTFVVILIVRLSIKSYEQFISELQLKNNSLTESETRLKNHQLELEDRVREKTERLSIANEELKRKNNEAELSYKKLKTAQSQLIETEKMATLGLMASGIAHEINNPLNYIKGSISALEIELQNELTDKDSQQIGLLLNAAIEGVHRISQIVRSMNAYNQNKDDLTTDCDLNEVLKNCLQILNKSIREGVRIVCDFNLPIIKGNPGKLHQIVSNILSNSLDAIEGEGGIRIFTQELDNGVSVIFEDTGGGIPKSKLSKVLDPFFTTKDPGKGTGLGLHVVNSLMKEHGGSVSISSEVGVGTTLSLNFTEKNLQN